MLRQHGGSPEPSDRCTAPPARNMTEIREEEKINEWILGMLESFLNDQIRQRAKSLVKLCYSFELLQWLKYTV